MDRGQVYFKEEHFCMQTKCQIFLPCHSFVYMHYVNCAGTFLFLTILNIVLTFRFHFSLLKMSLLSTSNFSGNFNTSMCKRDKYFNFFTWAG